MPIDAKAKQFLGDGPIQKVKGGEVKGAATAHAEYQAREYLERVDGLYQELMGFFLQKKKAGQYLDDECIGAIALFTINLREAYGKPQTPEEKKIVPWPEERREAKLAEFDAICEQMQNYYDENT